MLTECIDIDHDKKKKREYSELEMMYYRGRLYLSVFGVTSKYQVMICDNSRCINVDHIKLINNMEFLKTL